MNRNPGMSVARLALTVVLVSGVARAEDDGAARGSEWELAVGTGYGQGIGPVGSDAPMLQRLGGAGGTVQLDLARRLGSRWSVGGYGEFGLFDGSSESWTNHATTGAVGLEARVRFRPDTRHDPWASLGVGWRGYWGFGSWGTQELQGVDLARLRFGVDYWSSPRVAVGPALGITVTEFFSQKRAGVQSYESVSDPKLNTFLFAGIAGRFAL